MQRRKRVWTLMLSFALTLTACSGMMVSSGIQTRSELLPISSIPIEETDRLPSVVCSAFEPLSWSAQDTRQTIINIKRHNRKWLRVCDPDKYEELMRGQNEKL